MHIIVIHKDYAPVQVACGLVRLTNLLGLMSVFWKGEVPIFHLIYGSDMVAFNYDVLKTDVKTATRSSLEILLMQHRVTYHEPQHPYLSFYLNHGLCDVFGITLL